MIPTWRKPSVPLIEPYRTDRSPCVSYEFVRHYFTLTIDILYRDWNLRIYRVPMYVNLPVMKWQPFPATCGANGYSVAPSLLCIDGFGCCALHGAYRTYGDVWYERSGVRYCLPLLSCALWVSRRKRRSSREIAHDYSVQTRCGRLYKRETTTSFWNTEADRVFSG